MAAPQIHPTAFVAPTAQIGEDVVIGPCAVIEDDVVIGARTRIDAFASIKRYTTMGEDNHVYSYAAVGGEPQDLKFHGEKASLSSATETTSVSLPRFIAARNPAAV